jgi:hypothetical protein
LLSNRKIIERYAGLNKVSIVRFADDFPSPSKLKSVESGETIVYWPMKGGLRYVDLVIKTGIMREVIKTGSKKRSRKDDFVVKLTGVQITLESPTSHRGSLNFYETKNLGTEDFKRYMQEGEKVEHHFDWYVDQNRRAPSQTLVTTAFGVSQSVKVVRQ